jgi:hypothetical protein
MQTNPIIIDKPTESSQAKMKWKHFEATETIEKFTFVRRTRKSSPRGSWNTIAQPFESYDGEGVERCY